jgi:pimeloyl-ACP methyl ester carboxylesterase
VSVPTSHRLRANGLEHHVLVWEGPLERTVVLLHGYLDQARSFVRVGADLATAGHRVLAPDFRGHGESGWVPEGGYYHFPDYVADLAALLAQLAPVETVPAVSLVAHSMGGSVATLFAGTWPERVRALALLEGTGPSAMPPEMGPVRMGRWLEQLAKPGVRTRRRIASLEEAVQRLKVTHGSTVPEAVLLTVAREQTEPHPSGEGLTWRFDPLHQTTSPMRFDLEAFAAFARRITAPVLLVDGGANGMVLQDHAARQAHYARREVRTFEGAGHMLHWTVPDVLAAALVEFLAGK